MSLTEEVHAQIITAMKARDNARRDALRLVENALKTEAKEKLHDLSNDEEIAVLTRESKKRREAADAYREAGADDRAAKEEYELGIIQEFMPKQLTEDEVRGIIAGIVSELGITSKKDAGRVMKSLMPKIKGRFPGNDAKKLVDALEFPE